MFTPTRCAALVTLLFLNAGSRAWAQESVPAVQPNTTSLTPVTVVGREMSAADDYRVETLNSIGPLGTTKILDAPYSISILPLDLIENSQATNFKDVSKYLPLVSFQEQQGPEILRPQTRGMQGGNFQNSRMDGMQMFVTVANAMEQFQQIEVLDGVSASLYGPANPSGMFNFVTKRPTQDTLRRVGISYDTTSIATAHADLSGRIDDAGVVSYRINAVTGDGTGYVDGSRQKRNLGDIGVDVRPDKDTVIELNYSDYHIMDRGFPGWFTYGESIVLPQAPDPTRVGYGQTYAGVDLDTQTGSVRLKHDLSPNWHLVFGVLNQDATRDITTPVNNLRSDAGNYTSSLANGFAPRFVMNSDAGYLNGDFVTGGLSHDLTFGTAGYRAQSYSTNTRASAASLLLGSASIDNPQTFSAPAAGLPPTNPNFNSSTTYQQGVNLGDTIGFNDAWSTHLGVSEDWFHTTNYNVNGATLPGYTDSGLSPTASLIYKPQKNITTYVPYASSLQAGDVAPGTAANAGAGLAPYRSKQIETGLKVSLGNIDFTAAVFRIQRPFANVDTNDNIFKISGDQVNTGLEFTAVGQVLDHLTVYGGLTLLNAELQDTGHASTNDMQFVGAPKYKGNVLFEYSVPGIEGLVASVDWQYSGKRAGNDTNSFYVDGYNLFDIGARYTTKMWGKNVVWRLAVDNLTDKHYWSTVAPSNITGANKGNLLAHLGLPRTVLASATIDF